MSLGIACSSYNQAAQPTPSIVTPSITTPIVTPSTGAAQATRAPTVAPTPPSGTATAPAATQAAVPSVCPDEAAQIPASIPGVPAAPAGATPVKTASGLQYIDIKQGNGPVAQKGQTATVDYTGWLPDGKQFDASKSHPPGTFSFPLGGGQVIKGWDEGVANMQVGGQRRLIVPPNLAYGPRNTGGVIPACATLIFDVSLVGVK